MFYRDGDRDEEFHNHQTPPLGGRVPTVQTCQRRIPIPVGWAPMFLDYPPMGVVYRRLIQLMVLPANAANRRHFRAFGEGVALACGSPDPTAPNPISGADSSWKRVAYGKATLSAATAAWEGHQPGASKHPTPPGQNREHPPTLTTYLAGQCGIKKVINPGGTVGGTSHPTLHPPTPAPSARRHQYPQYPQRLRYQEVWTWRRFYPPSSSRKQTPNWPRPMPTMRTLLHSKLRRLRLWLPKAGIRSPSSLQLRNGSSKPAQVLCMPTSLW